MNYTRRAAQYQDTMSHISTIDELRAAGTASRAWHDEAQSLIAKTYDEFLAGTIDQDEHDRIVTAYENDLRVIRAMSRTYPTIARLLGADDPYDY